MDFETSFKQFEEIIKKLEASNLTLAQGIELFEKGVSLLKDCYASLGEAKGKITVLEKQLDEIVAVPLELNSEKNV